MGGKDSESRAQSSQACLQEIAEAHPILCKDSESRAQSSQACLQKIAETHPILYKDRQKMRYIKMGQKFVHLQKFVNSLFKIYCHVFERRGRSAGGEIYSGA
jgi:hypothetical protein